MDKQIKASMIIEIMGYPPDYIKESLENLVKSIDEEKGVSVTLKKVHEPKEIENENSAKKEKTNEVKKLFTTFVEIEAEFENLESLIFVVFKYMPSNIEIINPENFLLKSHYLSELLTGITMRLHKYDEITKKLVYDREVFLKRIKETEERKKRA